MSKPLQGKRALVGGASRGIGRASAEALAAMGAEIICLARNEAALQAVVDALPREEGQRHCWLSVDFDHPEALGDAIAPAIADGAVEIVINNTGGPPEGPAHTATLEDFRIAFNQHVICNQVVLQAVLPGMRAAGHGRIINIISTSVKEPIANLGVSNTIRGAVASWAKTLARELGPDGITVNNVLPGFTETERLDAIVATRAERTGQSIEDTARAMASGVPAQRFASANETAAAVAFLASPEAGYINGINLPVDGGRTGSL